MIIYLLVPWRMRRNVECTSLVVHPEYIVLGILRLSLDRLDVIIVA